MDSGWKKRKGIPLENQLVLTGIRTEQNYLRGHGGRLVPQVCAQL